MNNKELNNYNGWKEWAKWEKARDSRKVPKDWVEEKPQARDQSNKEPVKSSIIFSSGLSRSSKVRQLRSRQMVHIKQWGTKFQTLEEALPSQLCHPNSRSATVSGRTQEMPKERKMKFQTSFSVEFSINSIHYLKWDYIFTSHIC